MSQEFRANALFLVAGPDVGVANQGYVGDLLRAHHTYQSPVMLAAPEVHAACYLMVEFVGRHVGVVQAIRRDDSAVSGRSVVDDGPDGEEIVLVAGAKGKLAHLI